MTVEDIRKELHQIPELGRCEFKTKAYILNVAKSLKCKIMEVAKTGVILYFDCKKEHTLCFRADMDGLKIEEKTCLDFSSQHKGYMHACGHDGHMAMLLSFALWASDHLDELKYNIVCLFQPSEEDNAGAMDVLHTGILDELKVEKIFGMHIWPNLKEGFLFTMPNGMLATSAEVDIEIYGKAVHAANKEEGIDALFAATILIQRFYKEMDANPFPHLISFGRLDAGVIRNAVAEKAHIEATMRAFDDSVFEDMCSQLKKLTLEVEKEYKVKIELAIRTSYPSVMNSPKLINEYQNLLQFSLLEKPFLQAEDFGCYTRKYPALFLLLGCGNQHLLHTNDFDFNMEILSKGLEVYKRIAIN